jgi:hypothetical protein
LFVPEIPMAVRAVACLSTWWTTYDLIKGDDDNWWRRKRKSLAVSLRAPQVAKVGG